MSSEFESQRPFLENDILILCQQFLDRLGIVRKAIFEVHPWLAWKVWKKQKKRSKQEIVAYRQLHSNKPRMGIWEQEWNYYTHGLGCAMSHVKTGEPLEWDAGPENSFDKYWLLNWLKWRIDQDEDDSALQNLAKQLEENTQDNLKKVVFPVIDSLCTHQLLEHIETNNRYLI